MRRELERHPDVLIAALPHQPDAFAAMEPPFAPRPRTRKMIGMMSVILAGILLIMLGYLAVGVSGYFAFPTTVSSNALNNFASDDVLMQVSPPWTSLHGRFRRHIPAQAIHAAGPERC